MADLVTLRSIDAEPLGRGIRERLDEIIAMVEAGEVSSFAFAIVTRDGSSRTGWSEAPSFPLLLGSTARLAHRLNECMSDG